MTPKQLFIVKSLFDSESRLSTLGGHCEVLHDALPDDVAFMKQLIAEGSVVAYSTRSNGCGLPCFIFSGFTTKGHTIYNSFIDNTVPMTSGLGCAKKEDAHE